LFYGHVLAVGSFTSSPFRSGVSFFPLRFILYTILHYIPPTFISPTSAPHSKSNSFSAFRKAITQAFRVMAFAYPSLQWLLCFEKLQKPPTLQANCSCHSKPPTRFAPFRSVIAFALDPPHD
jgi:hypothetical protein